MFGILGWATRQFPSYFRRGLRGGILKKCGVKNQSVNQFCFCLDSKMKVIKERLDKLLVEKNLFPSREKAQAAIVAGIVYWGTQRLDKAGTMIPADAELSIKGKPSPYVSRGGLKLEKALDSFGISVEGRIALDIGASTGGFTQCLLSRGAKKVYAIDVGYGQLAWELQTNPKVKVLDRTNIRSLTPVVLYPEGGDRADLAVMDLSFISLDKVLPNILTLLESQAELVALVKPQFEAGPGEVGKGGIIKDPKVHRKVLEKVVQLAKSLHLSVLGLEVSPILGGKGNKEFLIHLKAGSKEPSIAAELVIESLLAKEPKDGQG